MKRGSALLLTGIAVSLAVAWNLQSRSQGRDRTLSEARHASGRSLQDPPALHLSSRVSRYFDPPSLERLIASGNISRSQAAELRKLLEAGEFEAAVRYGRSLPDTSLGRPAAIYYAWFFWTAAAREAALKAWSEHPELGGPVAFDGLMQGVAFSEPGNASWLKEFRASAVPHAGRMFATVGSMWLISGNLGPADFVAMASRQVSGWNSSTELEDALTTWTGMATGLTGDGRLSREAALQILRDLRTATDTEITQDAPESRLKKDFTDAFATASVEVVGLAAFPGEYQPPATEPAHTAFLSAVGMKLAERDPGEVAALASHDPGEGKVLWSGYAEGLRRSHDLEGYANRMIPANLPEEFLAVAARVAASHESLFHDANPLPLPPIPSGDESPGAPVLPPPPGPADDDLPIAPAIDQLPPSHLKKLILLQAADFLEKAGHGDRAEPYRQQAAALPD
jgi:hypothetical protein